MAIFLVTIILLLICALASTIKVVKEERHIHEGELNKYEGFLDYERDQYKALEQGRDEMEEGYQQMILDHQEQIQIKIVQVSIRDDIIRAQDEELDMRKIEVSNLEVVKEQQLKKIQALEKAINEALSVHDNLKDRIRALERVMAQRHWSLEEPQ
jgi:hypothetical protein